MAGAERVREDLEMKLIGEVTHTSTPRCIVVNSARVISAPHISGTCKDKCLFLPMFCIMTVRELLLQVLLTLAGFT